MSDRILVSTRKGLFTLAKQGGSWKVTQSAFLGDNVTLALPDARDGACYAALNHGHFGVKMHRSTDQGATWEECGVPVYPEDPEPKKGAVNYQEEHKPATLKLIWAFETGGADDDLLWAGTIPGGLFRSRDGATTWELVEPLWNHPTREKWFGGGMDQPGIHSICVDPRNSKRVGVGVSCAGFWVTEDGGETWDVKATGMYAEYMPKEQRNEPVVQDPHCIKQSPSNPDIYWCQHHNGIFKSEDNAENWQSIETAQPSKFGFAVAVHPTNPDRAWFVPGVNDQHRVPVDGKVVVSRTDDGGKTFEVLRDGLPQEHAYDIVFRHALDVDATGERLVIGSSTGGLWISENGGDSWQLVNAHLPQIYAVRFWT